MSKSTLKVQGILAGLFAAIDIRTGQRVWEAEDLRAAPSDSAIDTPDHP